MAQQQSWDSFYEEWSTLPGPSQAPATSGPSNYMSVGYPSGRESYPGQSYQNPSSGYYQEGNSYTQGQYDYPSSMMPTSEDSNDEGDYGYQTQQSPTMTSTTYQGSNEGYQQSYNGSPSMTTPTHGYSMTSPSSRSYSTGSQSAPYDCEHCGKQFEKRHLLNRHSKLHTKPIACPVSGCSHRVAKSRDMNRHLMAQHPDHELARTLLASPTHMCPVNGCKYASIGFRRKDNLERHVRNVHERRIP
ncbi:hypothetical protein BGZ60DRAFT_525372 [Tricladium varicosporioides]|nr:hypothetical protein BGZ60DRAFT_525372 [Hymenoscyphus varicosporioides]